MSRALIIKLASGVEAPERVSQAFTVAAIALASGIKVSLWLTGEASWFAIAGRAEEFQLAHSPSIADALKSLIAGARVTLCTQCAVRREIKDGDQIAGIRMAGAAVFVEEVISDNAQALVY